MVSTADFGWFLNYMLSYSNVKIMTLEYYEKLLNIYSKFKGMFYNGVCPKCEIPFKRHKNFFKRVYTT